MSYISNIRAFQTISAASYRDLRDYKNPLSSLQQGHRHRIEMRSDKRTISRAKGKASSVRIALCTTIQHREHVTPRRSRRGPYLPTVPELTHMPPLQVVQPVTHAGQRRAEDEEGLAVVPLFVREHIRLRESCPVTYFPPLTSLLQLLLSRVSQSSISVDSLLRTLFGRFSR